LIFSSLEVELKKIRRCVRAGDLMNTISLKENDERKKTSE